MALPITTKGPRSTQFIELSKRKGTWEEFKRLVEEAGVHDDHRINWINGHFGVNGVECKQEFPGEWTITDRY